MLLDRMESHPDETHGKEKISQVQMHLIHLT
jgi:hypothetical protein